MKLTIGLHLCCTSNVVPVSLLALLLSPVSPTQAVTFTTGTLTGCGDATYDGQDIVVDGWVFTVDRAPAFSSLTVVTPLFGVGYSAEKPSQEAHTSKLATAVVALVSPAAKATGGTSGKREHALKGQPALLVPRRVVRHERDCGAGATIEIQIMTDDYPAETTREVTDQATSDVVCEGGPYANAQTLYVEECCVDPAGCYDFFIFDSFGDGICCDNGQGYYNVYYEGDLVGSGGEFGSSDSVLDIGDGCGSDAVPTVSGWGMITMALLLLAAGSIVFVRRRPGPTAQARRPVRVGHVRFNRQPDGRRVRCVSRTPQGASLR